ncbi:MAG: NADH-quinone oxidoreductase subunit A [Alphaproteobacteria bacterium]
MNPYVYVLLFFMAAASVAAVVYLLSSIWSHKTPTLEKLKNYECGFDPIQGLPQQFNARFYVVAVLFVVFDLELALLFPWAISFDTLGLYGLLSVVLFLTFLGAGFIYEWKKGVFDWI